MSSKLNGNVSYRPEIDGLRAVAVLPVMIFHAGFGLFSGGYVGVDVFFVISGYLITSIIYREVLNGEFSYVKFYERRARRIFPALYVMMFVSIFFSYLFLIPQDYIDYSESLVSVVVFVSNIVFWQQSDYFAPAAELKPLLHTWSLAVEEQYYVFFPIVLMFFYRCMRKHVVVGVTAMLVLSLFLSHWAAFQKPTANYYLLPTRAWELLIGSVIALMQAQGYIKLEKINTQLKNLLAGLGLLAIVYAVFFFDGNTPFPSLWAVVPTLGAGLIIVFADKQTFTNRFLANKLLISIGLISYSAYLWHQPVYAFARHQHWFAVTDYTMALAFILSMICAYVSWWVVERPFRNRAKFSNQSIWLCSVLFGSLIIAIGIYGIYKKGFPDRFSLPEKLTEDDFQLASLDNGWCFYSVDTNKTLEVGEQGLDCSVGDKSQQPKALLFGDSFAGMYEPFWDGAGKLLSLNINSITTNWCYPTFSKEYPWVGADRAYEQCLYNRKYLQENIEKYEVIIFSAANHLLVNSDLFEDYLSFLEQVSETDKIIILMPQPVVYERNSVLRSVYLNGRLEIDVHDENVAIKSNRMLKSLSDRHGNVFFISRTMMFGGQDNGLTTEGIPYSLDGGHISIYGSTKAYENFQANRSLVQLEAILSK